MTLCWQKLTPRRSDDDFRLLILLTELRWVASLALAEQAVEVGECVEACGPADLADAVGGIHQPTGGMAQTDVDDVLTEILARAQFEISAEGRGCHADKVGQLLQAYLVFVVLVNVVFHL